MSLRVLLIVDPQNCFCPGGSLGVRQGEQIVGIANRLMEYGAYDAKVASQDWHPAEHCSFKIWPIHAVQGTKGAEFHPGLKVELLDHVVRKGCDPSVDSYSAFFDNDGVRETGLKQWLESFAQSRGAKLSDIQLTVMGLATDYCVKFTALDAVKRLDLHVDLAVDGCRAVDQSPEGELKTLRELVAAGVRLVDSRYILKELGVGVVKERPMTLAA